MSEGYPFPLSKAMKDSISKDLARIFPPWYGLDYMEIRPGDPAFVQFTYHWHWMTAPLISMIEQLVMNLNDPGQYESEEQQEEWRMLTAQWLL